MLNPYHEPIDVARILDLQQHQYQNTLYLAQEVPANSQIDAAVNITALGHFMLLSMTCDYTTKAAGPIDNGLCNMLVQIVDGSNQRPLFDNFIPANLFASPGRVKSIAGAIAVANPESQPLRLQYDFVYTFPKNSQIMVKIQNASDYLNIIRIAFKGIRIFPQSRNN